MRSLRLTGPCFFESKHVQKEVLVFHVLKSSNDTELANVFNYLFTARSPCCVFATRTGPALKAPE